MKRRLLSLFLSIMMLASIVGGILPAASASAASATGQTFFITQDADLVMNPDSPAGATSWSVMSGELLLGTYPVYATNTVDFLAGDWIGHIAVDGQFSGSITVRIGFTDPLIPEPNNYQYFGTQVLTYENPVSSLDFTIPASAFSINAPYGQLILQVSAMSNPMYFMAGGSNSWIAAPYGSDIFPSGEPQGDDSGGTPSGEPAWPSTPTFSDTTGDASGEPDIIGIDYLVDETNVYIRFIASADFSFYNQTIAVALDIDGNPATGSPDDSYGPVGSDYKIMSGYTEGTYSGTTFEKYGSPSPIDGVLFTDAVSSVPRYFFFRIPLSVLGVDAAEFQDGVKIDAVISSPGSSSPVILDEITGQNEDSGGSGGDDTPSEPAWPSTPFVEDDDNDAEGVFEITKVDYLSDSSYIYVRVSAGGTITYTNLISRTYFDIDQSTLTGCNNAMTAPLGSDYYVDITWDSVGTPSADVKKWDSTNGNWVLADFDISFVESATSYWFAVTAASFGTDFSEFATGLFLEQQIDMNGGNISDIASSDTTSPPSETFTLTIAANPPAGGTTIPAAGAHTYDSGTVVTINATPNVGYDFVNWIGDVASPTSLQTTVTMNEDKTVTANFQEAQLPQSDAWTVMVYMAADNDLEPDMLEDLNEMEVAGSSDKVNIVALFDGYGPANTNAYLIEKDPDGLDAILVSEPWVPYSGWSWDSTDEANMGDPGTLLEFIHKTVGEFPATHYALIFSNHGNGWRAADTTQSLPLKGVCTDVTDSDDYLTIAEISGALATITTGDSPLLSDGFGIIGFDACMMQMTEVAYELKDYGWFMVGSEETEQGDGWPYDAVFSEFVPANDTVPVICRDFADLIVSNYGEYYTSVAVDTYHTLSAVELKPSMSGGMDGLAAALDNFVRTVMSYNDYSTVDNASFNVDCFYDDTYIDLLDFVDQVRKTTPYTAVAEAAVAVKIVLVGDETLTTHPVIVSNVFGSDHPFAYGLSIYLPYPPDFSVPEPGYTSLALAEDTLWDEFINWYLSGGVIEPEWVELTADARGDVTTGVVDIYGVDFFKRLDILKSAYASGGIAFRVRSDVSLADTWASTGMTLLDTDRNPATGETGFGHDIGADYSLDVYYDDTVGLTGEIWKWDDAAGGWSSGPVGDFPVFTGMTDDGQTYYWMMVDFPVIGETDGFMDVVQIIDVDEYGMDKAPDTGHVSIAPRTTSDAVEDGLAWLVSQQNTDGSWGSLDSDHRLGETALAVYKLEQYAHDLEVSPLSVDYLYKQAVIDGLDFILGYGTIVDISNPQPNQAPDYTDNSPIGQGISFDCDHGLFHSYETYYTSISAMAIAALGNLDYTYTANASSSLYGMNYHDILANVVDFLAWGQSDYSWARGGWNYERMDNDSDYIRSDESNTGWVTLALAHAEEHGILTPGWVRSELERWVTYIQEPSTGEGTGGGAYYTGADDGMGVNALRTGNLLQQFAFLGDTAITPRVQLSLDYLSRVWNDWETAGPEVLLEGWYYGGYTPSFYHATYTIMKGLEAFGFAELPGPIDWYADFNRALLAEQNPDGSWPLSSFDQGDGVLSTVWALLTLEKDIPLTREGPDLTSLGIFPGWVSEQDGTYDVIVPLINKGNVAVSAGIIVDIYVNGVLQDTQTTPMPMIPGDNPVHLSFGTFTRDLQLDYDTIIVTIDPANAVQELNEDNNILKQGFPAMPDLVVKNKWEELVDEADPSQGYTVHFTVQNIGNGGIPLSAGAPLEVQAAVALDGSYQAGTVVLPATLEPGEFWTGVFPDIYFLPGDGSAEVTVTVDYTGVVFEWDETNNSKINTLDINPEDTTRPEVDSYRPNILNDVPVTTDIVITFTEAMDQAVTEAAFSIEPEFNGTITWPQPNQLVFTPYTDLWYDTGFMVTIGSGAADLAGNLLDGGLPDGSFILSFITETNLLPPSVQMVRPADDATNVPVTASVEITFTEPMNQASAEAAFELYESDSLMSGTFTWSSDAVMTFTPDGGLNYNYTYYVYVLNTAQSIAGISMQTQFTSSFQAEIETFPADAYELDDTPETAKPIIVNDPPQERNFHQPNDFDWAKFEGEVGVIYTIQTSDLGVEADTIIEVCSEYGYAYATNDNRLVIDKSSQIVWAPRETGTYYIKVRNYPEGAYGAGYTYKLQITAEVGSVNHPVVRDIVPGDKATGFAVNQPVTITFSEPMNTSVTAGAIRFSNNSQQSSITPVFTWNQDGTVVTCLPDGFWSPNTEYGIQVLETIEDITGQKGVVTLMQTFTTGAPLPPLAVTTGGADVTGMTTATLNGSLTSLGYDSTVEVYFVYGTDESNLTLPHPPGVYLSATGGFTADVTGLTAGTTYYYQAQAVGTTLAVGTVQSFTTVSNGVIRGETRDARGVIMPGVLITVDGVADVVSGSDGLYELAISEPGVYTIVANAEGYFSQPIELTVVDAAAMHTVDFKGDTGLVPHAPDLSFVLACINKWKFPPAGLGLGMEKVQDIIHYWKFPATPDPV